MYSIKKKWEGFGIMKNCSHVDGQEMKIFYTD